MGGGWTGSIQFEEVIPMRVEATESKSILRIESVHIVVFLELLGKYNFMHTTYKLKKITLILQLNQQSRFHYHTQGTMRDIPAVPSRNCNT